ncbi:hypothetical protein [Lentzea sp. NPDC059081]|uniref:hypothetical protein n=1 Tax=Lentzea sp. NPDC059081 TaxID=3346719 RepID=UPI0036B42947
MNAVLEGLAANPALPGHLLDRLVTVPSLGWTLASRPDLGPEHVRALLELDDPSVVAELLSRGRVVPSDVHSSDPAVLLALTAHPDCDPALVRSLALHPAARRRLPAVARVLPADVLELLAADPEVAAEVALHHALPPALAESLSRHPAPEVREAVASSPHTPAAVLTRLSAEDALARSLARNPATPAAVAAGLLRHHAARYFLASRTDLPVEVYEQLASEIEPGVLLELAANPAVPEEVARQLRKPTRTSPAPVVLDVSCSPESLHDMALSGDVETLRAIAQHPAAWGETLLLCLGDPRARHFAAGHPNLPAGTIAELLESAFTAGAAASNPSLPVTVMEELAGGGKRFPALS